MCSASVRCALREALRGFASGSTPPGHSISGASRRPATGRPWQDSDGLVTNIKLPSDGLHGVQFQRDECVGCGDQRAVPELLLADDTNSQVHQGEHRSRIALMRLATSDDRYDKTHWFFPQYGSLCQRRAHMEVQLNRLNLSWIERFPAVDGQQAHATMGSPTLPVSMNAAALGCYLSHRAAIEHCGDETYTLVLEDDTDLSAALPHTIHPAMIDSFANCDLVILECSPYYKNLNWYYQAARQSFTNNGLYCKGIAPDAYSKHYCTGACAYIVTPRGRRKLKTICARIEASRTFKAIDCVFHDAIHSEELVSWNLLPFLVTQSLSGFGSLIGYAYVENSQVVAPLQRWFQLINAFKQLMFVGNVDHARPTVEELTGLTSTSRDEQMRAILHACLDMRMDADRLGLPLGS